MINNIKNKIAEIYKYFIIDYKKLKNFFEKDFKKDSFKNAFIYCKHLIATNMNMFCPFFLTT